MVRKTKQVGSGADNAYNAENADDNYDDSEEEEEEEDEEYNWGSVILKEGTYVVFRYPPESDLDLKNPEVHYDFKHKFGVMPLDVFEPMRADFNPTQPNSYELLVIKTDTRLHLSSYEDAFGDNVMVYVTLYAGRRRIAYHHYNYYRDEFTGDEVYDNITDLYAPGPDPVDKALVALNAYMKYHKLVVDDVCTGFCPAKVRDLPTPPRENGESVAAAPPPELTDEHITALTL